MDKAAGYVLAQLKKGRTDLERIKREAAARFGGGMAKNSDILRHGKQLPTEIRTLLRKKPVRTLSGITTVAVMVRPDGSCTHKCVYCPYTGKAAKSYTGEEPAALRARNAGYDPAKQVRMRLKQYEATGHLSQKCEAIIMGGTFLEMPGTYKARFVESLYDAMNERQSKSIAEAKKANETADHRVVGLTIETRPDVCGKSEINEMLGYGATRVELGVQHPSDMIYKKINRGHSVRDVVKATALLKDSAFKVLYHLMPGLPGSDRKKDIAMAKRIFENEKFRPDMLKIYPTLAIAGTELYGMIRNGGYEPYAAEEAADVISEMFRHIPKYVRVMRVQRDIPANLISSGVKKSNLRELVEKKISEKGIKAREIRSREIGLTKGSAAGLRINRLDYNASGGKEIFISYENEKTIAGFIRLRIPGKNAFREEITEAAALIRELHVYGQEESIGLKGKIQHTGIGRMLLTEAEEIAENEMGAAKMVIISGTGVKEYYRKLGYKNDGPYVSKNLRR